MLSPSSRSGVHGTIEIEDGPTFEGSTRRPKSPGSNSAIMKWARSNFRIIYITLAILILIGLAVLVVAIFLITKVKGINEKYQNESNAARDQFRRLYEQVAMFRTGGHGTFRDMGSLNFSLTPEQLAQAKLFGLIPNNPGQLSPGVAGLEPIKAISNYSGPPPLIVISLDGFAREYLDRKLVPSLDLLAKCGARADFVYPSYPSKTFPNHYTIATGLYPEAHGIVDNAAYDPNISPILEDMKKTKFPQFFGGEPIWSQAVRHGKKMFCLFWPGCSFNITGYNPTKDLPYNRSLQYSQRVDMVIDWLQLPSTERPSMIMAYFDQPDYVGHFHTTDEQVNLELQYIESVLNYLFTSLYTTGLMDCVNIVILSDHGMQFLRNKIFVDQVIDSKGMIVATGVVGRIHLANSSKTTEEVIDKFACPSDKSYR
uniref:Uncharacterized protein n=1 Tax=Panagrolaimus sp. PS1159 TaxID=55785 RepID=A0AC35GVL6_9BILA